MKKKKFSFTVRLRPVTKEVPKVLLPLVNSPMLDYTLELLSSCGVQQIFVMCCAHAQKVDEYLRNSHWTKRAPELRVEILISEDYISAGDALRHLDTLDLIQSDFILVLFLFFFSLDSSSLNLI